MDIDEAIEALEKAYWSVNFSFGEYEVWDADRKYRGILEEQEIIDLATLEA